MKTKQKKTYAAHGSRAARGSRGYKQRLVDELRDHVRNGVPHDLTFKPLPKGTTSDEREKLQQELNFHFKLWADTWVYPWIDLIEQALRK
jgi:hypothetical protein